MNTSREVELHERVHGLLSGLKNVEETVVRAALELANALNPARFIIRDLTRNKR